VSVATPRPVPLSRTYLRGCVAQTPVYDAQVAAGLLAAYTTHATKQINSDLFLGAIDGRQRVPMESRMWLYDEMRTDVVDRR
jgi:hypothetical protein